MDYIIPQALIDTFVSEALKNKSSDDARYHVETLAYITGYEENNKLIANEIILPNQQCSQTEVIDEGNYKSISVCL